MTGVGVEVEGDEGKTIFARNYMKSSDLHMKVMFPTNISYLLGLELVVKFKYFCYEFYEIF